MTGTPTPGPEELPILLGPSQLEPERLMLVGRPAGGRVRTREWTGKAWGEAPTQHEYDPAELYAELERASRTGRSVNQELYAVRRWLELAR